jgi:hypothetical protein
MPDPALITVLSGAGVAGVFCCLFILGLIFPKSVLTDKDEEIKELKSALASERERADTAVAAAQASRDMMAALQAGIQLARQSPPSGAPPPLEDAGLWACGRR